MHTCWTSPKYADNALKAYNAWGWLNALLMVNPDHEQGQNTKPRTLTPNPHP